MQVPNSASQSARREFVTVLKVAFGAGRSSGLDLIDDQELATAAVLQMSGEND
jgi:hypothetical protein